MNHLARVASRWVKRALSLLFAILFALSSSGLDPAQANTPAQGRRPQLPDRADHMQALVDLVSASGQATSPEATAGLKKMDSQLQDLLGTRLRGQDVAAAAKGNGLRLGKTQSVLVDIYTRGGLGGATDELKALGMDVLATNAAFGGVVEGYLPVDSLVAAAVLGSTRAFLAVPPAETNTGSVLSEGDAAHSGPAARSLGVDGSGVVVGILSDSINQVGGKLAGSQAGGDLPAGVTVLSDDPAGTDEGRAMAEVIYDTAPGITSMYFASDAGGPLVKALSILNLVGSGVDIIVDDSSMPGEPFFQDGFVSQAADTAYNGGVAYFAAAGNRGRQSYEQGWRDGGELHTPLRAHDFDPGPGIDYWQTIGAVPNGACFDGDLQWANPWFSVTYDLDWFLLNASTHSYLTWSWNDNVTTGAPAEAIHWCNNTGSTVTVENEIEWRPVGSQPAPVGLWLKYTAKISGVSSFTIAEYDTSSSTISPDAAAANGAMAVAAVNWNESGLNDPEPGSSRGPVTRRFNIDGIPFASPQVRQKPQVAGADCVWTSYTFAANYPFGNGTFCGTSAATASVAGVAALVLDMIPSLTPAQLYATLGNASNTYDCTAAGNPDYECGYGFVRADRAVAYALDNYGTPLVDPWYGGATIQSTQLIVAVGRPHIGSEVTSYGGVETGADASYLPMLFKHAWGSYDSAFYIQNMDTSDAATVTVKYYDTEGNLSCTKPEDTIPIRSSHGIWVPGETCLPAEWVGSAVIRSTLHPITAVARPHVGAQVMTYNGFGNGWQTMYLPMLFKNAWGSYDSAFYIQNVRNLGSAHVTVKYYDTSGNLTCTKPADTIPPLATHGIWVPGETCLPAGWVGGAVITSADEPIVAVARLHVGAEVTTYDGFGAGNTEAYAPMLFKNAFGGSYDSAFYIQNIDPSNAAHVTVKYYDSSGNLSCTKPVDTIPALSSHGIWVPSETCLPVGWVGGAVITSSDYPIVVVARPHVGAQVTTYDGIPYGSTGANLPMLFKNMWGTYNSAFYVENVDYWGQPTVVTVKLYDVNGTLNCIHRDIIPGWASQGYWVPTMRCLP